MIETLKNLKIERDSMGMNPLEVMSNFKGHVLGVSFMWILFLLAVGALAVIVYNISGKLYSKYLRNRMSDLSQNITDINKDMSNKSEYNLLTDEKFKTKPQLSLVNMKNKQLKIEKILSTYELRKTKLDKTLMEDEDIAFLFLPLIATSLAFMLFSFIYIDGRVSDSFNLEEKSMEVYNKEIANYPVNNMLVMRVTKIGMNNYNIIYKNGSGTVVEKEFKGKIVETKDKGVFYEFNYYPYPEEFEDTYFERNTDELIHGSGVQNEVLKISSENMKVINGKSEYLHEDYK